MTRLEQIPVRVEPSAPVRPSAAGLSAAGLAILHEIDTLLEAYQAFGRAGAIDLRWLSLMPGDYEELRQILGRGEVSAEIASLGASTAAETAFPCVWWVTHRDPDGEVLAEFIEICQVPSILRGDRGAIAHGLVTLRERMAALARTAAS